MVDLECIPFGAGHGDEGVCLLLKLGPYRVLCDCGLTDLRSLLSQDGLAAERPTFAHPDWPADLALCSHAHSDHGRGLLGLHRAYPDLPIYASAVTAQLLPLNWPAESDRTALNFCRTLPWRTPLELLPGLVVQFYPAGHLPGAAACLLTFTPTAQTGRAEPRSYTIFYTGDFLLSNSRLVDGLPLADLRGLNPDILILEGSFGTARHPHRRQQETQLTERILTAIQQGWSVLLPVPDLGLGQELLMLMRSHHTFTGKDLDIWVADAIAQTCDVYLTFVPDLPPTVQNFAQHQPLFWDERIRPRVRRLPTTRKAPLEARPCIVLMSETADIQAFCDRNPRPWLVLVPEHRPREQAGGDGRDFSMPVGSAIAPRTVLSKPRKNAKSPGNLVLDTFLLAEHCDGPSTMQLIHNLRPQHVVLMHGCSAYLADLISLEELASRYHLHSPGIGTRLELPVGEAFMQPMPPPATESAWAGELHDLKTEILIKLPPQLREDPRWRGFADTGLIEVSWQGEMLMLRSLSQRELWAAQHQSADVAFRGCANCQSYRGQRCWNQTSPLYGLRVAPEGYCPAFALADVLSEPPLSNGPNWLDDAAAE
ncbi:MAG: MBL fold metallo-hydrolase [Thermosynechococcaceae cyanobacterium]